MRVGINIHVCVYVIYIYIYVLYMCVYILYIIHIYVYIYVCINLYMYRYVDVRYTHVCTNYVLMIRHTLYCIAIISAEGVDVWLGGWEREVGAVLITRDEFRYISI